MTSASHLDMTRRHDFVLLFDVQDGNPNGDPDAGNLPRVDPETMQGLVTDVSLKRKVRDWVDLARGDQGRYKIYVQNGGTALNTLHQRAYDAEGLKSSGAKQARNDVERARAWMCANFYDIRIFGAVMTTGVNCGQVRGPVQLTFARSIDPIVPLDLSITRVAVTRPEDARVLVAVEGGEGRGGKRTEMGRKAVVPYGLYRAYGFVNPHFAVRAGADAEDLELFWQALQQMWDVDRSSSRGLMGCQGLYVFTHESPLGNAPVQRLFDHVRVARRPNVDVPRSFRDYTVEVDDANLPAGITLTSLVG
jgi:CRISPR-associated protein Csd2